MPFISFASVSISNFRVYNMIYVRFNMLIRVQIANFVLFSECLFPPSPHYVRIFAFKTQNKSVLKKLDATTMTKILLVNPLL